MQKSEDDPYDYDDDDFDSPFRESVEIQPKILFQNTFVGYKSQYSLLEKIYHCLDKITQQYGLSEGAAFSLLNLNNWSLEKTERFMNDRYAFPEYESVKEEDYCPICYDNLKANFKERMVCGHVFCFECFEAYLKEAIREGPACLNKTCPKNSCKEIVGPSLFRKYLFEKYKTDFIRYEKFLVDNFVISSHTLKWCPGKDCKQAIDLEASKIVKFSQKNIKCQCGCSFCLACEKEAHMPAKCEQFANWLSLILGKNTKVDELWIKIHTKKCPQCKVAIEKNLGCMHMTCKNCSFEFCWLCLGDWKGLHGERTGGFYSCNIYKEDPNVTKELSETEKEIKRLNFYMDRYQQHQSSLRKAEEKKREKFDLFVDYKNNLKTSDDIKMLGETLDLLVECRRCISYTYVIAYYLGSEKKDFFQFLQAELEKNIENLDEATDADFLKFDSKEYVKWKNKLKNLKDILKNYSENVLSDLEKNLPDLMVLEKQKSLHTGKTVNFFETQIEEDQHWYCMACTFANGHERTTCEMCGNARGDANIPANELPANE